MAGGRPLKCSSPLPAVSTGGVAACGCSIVSEAFVSFAVPGEGLSLQAAHTKRPVINRVNRIVEVSFFPSMGKPRQSGELPFWPATLPVRFMVVLQYSYMITKRSQ